MLRDVHSLLVLFVTVYFALIAVLNGTLAAQGYVSFQSYVSAHTLVFINIFFGFAYLIYTNFWRGNVYLQYENTDWRKLVLYASLGAVLHLIIYFVSPSLSSVSQIAAAVYMALLGSAYALVAFTENAFFIGVIGDYFAERFGHTRRGHLLASLVAALAAGLTAATFHIGVYGSSPVALAIVAFWFGYWTFASLETGSTLYADFHHAFGNYIGFVRSSVVEVIA